MTHNVLILFSSFRPVDETHNETLFPKNCFAVDRPSQTFVMILGVLQILQLRIRQTLFASQQIRHAHDQRIADE